MRVSDERGKGAITLLLLADALAGHYRAGFVGLGMHLRGFSRQMGGLYVWRFNLLEGPPALFIGFAAVGLVAVYLL